MGQGIKRKGKGFLRIGLRWLHWHGGYTRFSCCWRLCGDDARMKGGEGGVRPRPGWKRLWTWAVTPPVFGFYSACVVMFFTDTRGGRGEVGKRVGEMDGFSWIYLVGNKRASYVFVLLSLLVRSTTHDVRPVWGMGRWMLHLGCCM
ncbi:uncharacterized protein B0H64DRAFT_53708 [Chaetomium fimeti]|uniref:Uncharacterized protein n=1 Tax=Chaetomium fimeti TaxID=1854472 RepID=A0AAE0LN07_9PEZI|nr:hypothetical protein B0H64DRAFT_53708 [Chaetomium fimeti]